MIFIPLMVFVFIFLFVVLFRPKGGWCLWYSHHLAHTGSCSLGIPDSDLRLLRRNEQRREKNRRKRAS